MKRNVLAVMGLVAVITMQNCGNPNSNSSLSYSLPPVVSAVPKRLQDSKSSIVMPFSSTSINEQFFGKGTTSIYSLLNKLDDLISKTNDAIESDVSPPCLTQAPVSYSITPFGQTVMMYAQCFTQGKATVTNPDLFQFGTNEGIQYIYSADAAQRMAVILTPIEGSKTNYEVQAWIGLGYNNAGTWDSGSYGVMQLKTNSLTKNFELSVAGIGFDQCGFQLISDGLNIKAEGSQDGGTICNIPQTICKAEGVGDVDGTCVGLDFTLPALGRKFISKGINGAANGFGETRYPSSGGNILLSGSIGDALYFGPLKAIPNIGRLKELQ